MNADAFRQFYDDHFTFGRMLWDSYITQLSDEQFTQLESDMHPSEGDMDEEI